MKDTDKVTLTFGQLKKLVKESNEIYYSWAIINIRKVILSSGELFVNPEDAYNEGFEQLKKYNDGYFKLEVFDIDNPNDVYMRASNHYGKISED